MKTLLKGLVSKSTFLSDLILDKGAGSVVTKSFIQDDIAIVGNPAKIIKYLK